MNIFLKIVLVTGIFLVTVFFFIGSIFISILLLRRLGFLPECYKLVEFDGEIIHLRAGRKAQIIRWRQIDSIFSYSISSCSKRRISGPIELELKSGEKYTLAWLSGDVHLLLGKFYNILLENQKLDVDDIKQLKFTLPPSWIHFVSKNFRQIRLFSVLLGLLWLALWTGIVIYSHRESLDFWITYFFALFIPILCLVVIFRTCRLEREHKRFLSIEINEDSLSFQDELGNSQTRFISDVIGWNLDKTKGALAFSDGTRFNDLEKLRYWPILREYLLSKLKPSAEHEDK